jgi:hypothetical protein
MWTYRRTANPTLLLKKFIAYFFTMRELLKSNIDEGVYNNSFNKSIDCYNKILNHYQSSFNVKEVKNSMGVLYFYKITNNQIAVPSLIFDMANFISSLVSLSNVEYSDKENDIEKGFNRSVKDYLSQIIPIKDLYFNEYLDTKKEVK